MTGSAAKTLCYILAAVCSWANECQARQSVGIPQETEKEEMVIGTFHKLNSKILNQERRYVLHLPPGYEDSEKSYPVVYLLNGEMTPSFALVAGTLERLSFDQVPEFILIGIAGRDLPVIPCRSREDVDKFLGFITDELIPHVDANYRTEKYRILVGQSNTGLFAIYAMLGEPDVFNACFASSPSIGWCPEFIRERVEEAFSAKDTWNNFLFMIYGGKDIPSLVNDYIGDFVKLLEQKAPSGLVWKLEYLERDGHVPIASFNNGLLTLFPDFFVSPELESQGLQAINRHFEGLTQRYGFKLETPEEALFSLAYNLRQKEKRQEAIDVFRVLLERYPRSVRSYFFLAETYLDMGQREGALANYKKALEIDPDFSRAKTRVKELEQEQRP
jgi:predicted alpha/beta superfamily hydrolase